MSSCFERASSYTPNPFATPDDADAYRSCVRELLRIVIVAAMRHPAAASAFSAMTVMGLATSRDSVLPVFRAFLWEMGDEVTVLSGGRHVDVESVTLDEHNDTVEEDGLDSLNSFGRTALETFFRSASGGDLRSALNVVNALEAEADREEVAAEAVVGQMVGNAIVSLALTLSVRMGNPLGLFRHDHD